MSELDALLTGASSADNNGEENKEDSSEAAGQDDAEKTDYDYLLGMNLWSLTYEKVEEIKKQHEAKAEELNILQKTSIEQMWDRDLQELVSALDEVEAFEAKEAEASLNAMDARRQKDSKRQANRKPIQRSATMRKRVDDDEDRALDKALLKRPLQAGVDTEDVQKTTWGTGMSLTRKNTDSFVSQNSEVGRDPGLPALKARRPRGPGDAPAAPPPPPKDEGAGALLSRLLSRSSTAAPSTERSHSSLDIGSLSSFSSLGGGEDMFAYLRIGSGDSTKPYNSLDFGAPPGGTAGTADSGGSLEDRGRDATKRAAEDADAGANAGDDPAKRRKK